MSGSTGPIASLGPMDSCTLTPGALAGRLAEFDEAFAAGLRHAELVSPTHARWVFTADQARSAELGGLLARESECCSFFGFAQQATGDTLTVDVTVPAAHATTLAALTERATGFLQGLRNHA